MIPVDYASPHTLYASVTKDSTALAADTLPIISNAVTYQLETLAT